MVSGAWSTTQSLIKKKEDTGFSVLSEEDMHHHLHVAKVHQGMTGSKSTDVCEMTGHAVDKSEEQGVAATEAMKASYEESMRSVLSKHCNSSDQLESLMKDVQTTVKKKMNEHYTGAAILQKINHPTSRSTIRRSYVEGPNSILKNLPMPEVDTLHGYPRIPVKQTVNHLIALGIDAMVYRAGFEEDWVGVDGKHECQYIKTLHEKVKARLVGDSPLSNDTCVHILRVWSDGFQPKKVKTKNDFESMQLFTLTLRASRGNQTDMHTLPYALCFKKQNHHRIFLQLLSEVQELQSPRLRHYVKDKQLYQSGCYLDLIINDYPERCANTSLSQLGLWCHRWGHSCIYDSATTPSCSNCELRRIDNVLTGSDNVRIEDCGKCQDWWCTKRENTHTGVNKYPVEPGESPWNKKPSLSVELSFEMMENSIESLQRWYRQTAEDIQVTKEEKKNLRKDATDYLSMIGISPQYVPGLTKDIAEGEEACKSSSYPPILKLFKELDVEVRNFGSVPMHMCALGCEKKLISKTSMIANRALKEENAMWKSLNTSMKKSQRAISNLSVQWCLAMSYSGKKDDHNLGTANWLSDHYLGFTRLSLYHFGPLDGSINLPEGKKKVLAAFRKMRVLWFCLMSNMLAEEIVPVKKIDNLVKLFLSSCRTLCLLTGTESLGSACSGECVGRRPKNKESSSSSSASENEIESTTPVMKTKKRKRKEILTECTLPTSKKKSKNKNTKKRQRKESPNNSKISASERHLKKKRKEGEVLEDNSSSEHEIISVRKTKKREREEIPKDTNLAARKNKAKKKLVKKLKAPFYVSTVNFLSLLNIWSMIEHFGSVRDCWESTEEAYIQKVKKELKTMRHTDNFIVSTLRKLLSTSVFSVLNKDNPHNDKVKYKRTCNFKIYSCNKDENPESILKRNKMVSGIVDLKGRLMVCLHEQRGGDIYLYPLEFEDSGGVWCYDLWYSRATLGNVRERCEDLTELLKMCSDHFLLLKQEFEHELISGCVEGHTVLCRSWRVRVESGELTLPSPSKKTLLMR